METQNTLDNYPQLNICRMKITPTINTMELWITTCVKYLRSKIFNNNKNKHDETLYAFNVYRNDVYGTGTEQRLQTHRAMELLAGYTLPTNLLLITATTCITVACQKHKLRVLMQTNTATMLTCCN